RAAALRHAARRKWRKAADFYLLADRAVHAAASFLARAADDSGRDGAGRDLDAQHGGRRARLVVAAAFVAGRANASPLCIGGAIRAARWCVARRRRTVTNGPRRHDRIDWRS